MIHFRAIVADPLRLGREFRFYDISGNKLTGSDYDSDIELELDIEKAAFTCLLTQGPRNFARYYAEMPDQMIVQLGQFDEEAWEAWKAEHPIPEEEEQLELAPELRKLISLMPIGEACIDIISGILKAGEPEVEIIECENCPFDYAFFIDGEEVTLEDFVLEVQRQADK